MDLATKVAALQYHNPDYVLMFRGQDVDVRNRSGNTSLKPGLLRARAPGRVPTEETISRRFRTLQSAEALLIDKYREQGFAEITRLSRQRILRWAILQHYQICDTPLLDVTQSLRIAASFASEGDEGEGFVFVLGVPHLSGAITASAEAGLQIVRLASVCPPVAVRPHIQEGYVLGEYPDFVSVEQKAHYQHHELDFGLRLIAKFRFDRSSFWLKSGPFPKVPPKALYPSATSDPMRELADAVKDLLPLS